MSWRDQPRDNRGRWTKKGGGLVAALVALVIGAGGAGAEGGAAAASGGSSAAGRSTTGSQGKSAQARARSTARAVQRLRARGLRVDERGTRVDTDCVAHSYGQVREYFRQHPCTALARALLEVRDGQVTVLVAVAAVDMPDEAKAAEVKRFVDRPGTGNLTELTKEGVPPTSVRWTGEQYASVQDGVTFVNAQAEPVGRTAQAIRLAELVAGTAIR